MRRKPRNLPMNREVYKLRRKVMEFIYEAKRLYPPLPRITVRVTETEFIDDTSNYIAGQGSTEGVRVWIPEKTLQLPKNEIRWVVYHEIMHAVFGAKHRNDGLMTPWIPKNVPPKQRIQELFVREIERYT